MLDDYKLNLDDLYIYVNKDSTNPTYIKAYGNEISAGTGHTILTNVYEFHPFVCKEANSNDYYKRAVRLGNDLYWWSDEVKAESLRLQRLAKRQAKQNPPDAKLIDNILNALKSDGYIADGRPRKLPKDVTYYLKKDISDRIDTDRTGFYISISISSDVYGSVRADIVLGFPWGLFIRENQFRDLPYDVQRLLSWYAYGDSHWSIPLVKDELRFESRSRHGIAVSSYEDITNVVDELVQNLNNSLVKEDDLRVVEFDTNTRRARNVYNELGGTPEFRQFVSRMSGWGHDTDTIMNEFNEYVTVALDTTSYTIESFSYRANDFTYKGK